MLNFEELRKIDPQLSGLSDKELFDVRAKLYELAQLAFDAQEKEKENDSKNPVGLVTPSLDEDTI